MAKLIRSMIDFESSASSGLEEDEQQPSLKNQGVMQSYRLEESIQESPLGIMLKQSILAIEPLILILNGKHSRNEISQDLLVEAKVWTFGDYINFILGLIDGIFGALP